MAKTIRSAIAFAALVVLSTVASADSPPTIIIDGNLTDGGDCASIGTWQVSSGHCYVDRLVLDRGTLLTVDNASLWVEGEVRSLGANIENRGTIWVWGGFLNVGTIDNEGHLTFEGSLNNEAEGVIRGSGFLNQFGYHESTQNAGTIVVGGTLYILGQFENLAAGTITIGIGANVFAENPTGGIVNRGRWDNFGIVYGQGTQIFNFGVIDSHGTFNFCDDGRNGVLRNHGTLNNHGSLAICGTSENFGTINNAGTIIERGPLSGGPGTIENAGLIQNCGSIVPAVTGNLPVADLDGDSDGVCNGLDCAPTEAALWRTPDDARGLRLSHTGGLFGVTTLDWVSPVYPGGVSVLYDVISSADPADFISTSIAACVETGDASDTTATDFDTPWPDELSSFLVRAGNVCGDGPSGTLSDGSPRLVRECP